jgi:alkanesulfonate monooxygenase SsuD/methylene tetrahydromethanopterin reductase-like flavin-dependent oxidoreductase (luciferase family)
MEFGIFYAGYVPKKRMELEGHQAEHNALMEGLKLVQQADRHNWKYAWIAEHHFLIEYSHMSANEVYLGHLSSSTERIHLGTGITSFSPYKEHPARIAERVAMLDHLSEGRFEFGMGRGAGSYEVMAFGLESIEATRDIWDEFAPQMWPMLSGEAYSFEGRHFRLPHQDAKIPERLILPQPWIRPHPPMWVAAGSTPTFEKAARLGLGVLAFTTRSIPQMAPLVAEYKSRIGAAEPIGAYVNDNAMIASALICLEDGLAARKLACEMGLARYHSLLYYYHDAIPTPPGTIKWPEVAPEPTLDEIEQRIEEGFMICGDPDECAQQVQAAVDAGIDQLAFGADMLPFEANMETLRLFGEYVIPKFDTDPVHRSTRMRQQAADDYPEDDRHQGPVGTHLAGTSIRY